MPKLQYIIKNMIPYISSPPPSPYFLTLLPWNKTDMKHYVKRRMGAYIIPSNVIHDIKIPKTGIRQNYFYFISERTLLLHCYKFKSCLYLFLIEIRKMYKLFYWCSKFEEIIYSRRGRRKGRIEDIMY